MPDDTAAAVGDEGSAAEKEEKILDKPPADERALIAGEKFT